MYFEPSKKTYYRFPSNNHNTDYETENEFYFPTNSANDEMETHAKFQQKNQSLGRQTYYESKL